MLIHRKVWEEARGPIPEGMTIDHLCMQKTCINPDHMEVVTRSENSRRRLRAQTHCVKGHPLSGENVVLLKKRDGYTRRCCVTCRRATNRAYMQRARRNRATESSAA